MLTRKKTILSLIFYFLVLVWIISFKMNMKQAVFECMYIFSKYEVKERFMISIRAFNFLKMLQDKDFYMNICVFMPFGVYCAELLKKNKFIKGLIIAFFLSLLLETIQLLTTIGFFTINDLISNTLGYIVGYFTYLLLKKLLNKKIMYVIFIVFSVFFVVLSIYVIINTILNI